MSIGGTQTMDHNQGLSLTEHHRQLLSTRYRTMGLPTSTGPLPDLAGRASPGPSPKWTTRNRRLRSRRYRTPL